MVTRIDKSRVTSVNKKIDPPYLPFSSSSGYTHILFFYFPLTHQLIDDMYISTGRLRETPRMSTRGPAPKMQLASKAKKVGVAARYKTSVSRRKEFEQSKAECSIALTALKDTCSEGGDSGEDDVYDNMDEVFANAKKCMEDVFFFCVGRFGTEL